MGNHLLKALLWCSRRNSSCHSDFSIIFLGRSIRISTRFLSLGFARLPHNIASENAKRLDVMSLGFLSPHTLDSAVYLQCLRCTVVSILDMYMRDTLASCIFSSYLKYNGLSRRMYSDCKAVLMSVFCLNQFLPSWFAFLLSSDIRHLSNSIFHKPVRSGQGRKNFGCLHDKITQVLHRSRLGLLTNNGCCYNGLNYL